jgi:recombination protein RecR
MATHDPNDPLDIMIKTLSRLPGLGPRSARRAALHLLKKREQLLTPLANQMLSAAELIKTCHVCGNLSLHDPCLICTDPKRTHSVICVVEDVDDIWAMERTGAYEGVYHILGGTLSALDGIRPEDLRIPQLLRRLQDTTQPISEIILALSTTVDGQSTAYYIADQAVALHLPTELKITRLAQGMPIGGELDYLDEGTLTLALQSRSNL